MIEAMKKVTIFSLKERREKITEQLRQIGLMHIESMTFKSEGALVEEKVKSELEKVLSSLEEVKEKKEKITALKMSVPFEEVQASLLSLCDEKKDLLEELNRLNVEKERLEAFGNLDPALVESLFKDGLSLHFYTISDKDYLKGLSEDKGL